MNNEIDGNNLAAVFIANKSGQNGGIKKAIYIMSLKDAIKFCTHEKTRKSNMWSFHWTLIVNFVDEKTGKIKERYFRKKDDGRFSDLMNELDIEVFDVEEVCEMVFENLDDELSDDRLGKALQDIADEQGENNE